MTQCAIQILLFPLSSLYFFGGQKREYKRLVSQKETNQQFKDRNHFQEENGQIYGIHSAKGHNSQIGCEAFFFCVFIYYECHVIVTICINTIVQVIFLITKIRTQKFNKQFECHSLSKKFVFVQKYGIFDNDGFVN